MWAMIPGPMGTRSYIVTGLEHLMAFRSALTAPAAAHGRRGKQYTMSDLDTACGIEFRRSSALLDEIPSAYKNIDEVMAHAKDLVEIKHVLKQFVNVKGD
jgi:tRNA-splicing ligase RtcB